MRWWRWTSTTAVPAVRARAWVMGRSMMMAAEGRWRCQVRVMAVVREHMRLLVRMRVLVMLTRS